PRGRGPGHRGARGGEPARLDPVARAHHESGAIDPRRARGERLSLPHLAIGRDRGARPGAGGPDTARRPGTRREPAPPGRGLRDRHARTGARYRGPGRRRRGGQRDRGSPRPGWAGRGGAPGARARRGGARAVTANRLVVVYSRALAIGGPLLLVAILSVDPRWTGQLLEIVVMTVAAVLLRGAQVPLSKYSYLTQTGLVAIAGCLLVGAPATALAVAGGVLAADWLWQKKMFRAALVNLGREVVAVVGAYGIYAGALRVSEVTAPGLHVELVPALFFYALAYFVISRLLFYFALIIRGKLEQDERLLILRYECIGYGASLIAVGIIVGTVAYWPPLAWVFVAAALGALGLLFKHTLEEAIAAEELNKIHAMEAVITSNISLEDSFARIERLAHRLVDWGDFRIYRRQEGAILLAYRGQIGRPDRGPPTPDTEALRGPLVETVETLTQQLATLARAALSMREAAGAVAQSTSTIRQGVLAEEGEVSGGLEATESLAQVSRRVSEDGTEAAQASSTA